MRLLLILFMLMFVSCERTSTSNREIDEKALSDKFNQIEKISNSVTCTDASQWKFTSIGVKVCGGPVSFIPYHKSINEAEFLKMIQEYNQMMDQYNKKWGAVSDCSVSIAPKGISCVDGKAVFIIN